MKYTSVLLFLLLSCQTEKDGISTSPDYKFKGKVKTMLERFSKPPLDYFGEVKINAYPQTSFLEYAPNGYLQKKTLYYEGKSMADTTTIVFHYEDGNLVARDDFKNGKLDQNLTYENTISGLPKKINTFRDGALLLTEKYQYDDRDSLLEKEGVFSFGGVRRTEYSYDSLGHKVRKAIYENDYLTRHWLYFYDEQGQIYEEADLNHSETWADEIFHIYGKHNQLLVSTIDRAYMSGRSYKETIIYKYGVNDQLIEKETRAQDGVTKEIWEYQYDKVGNRTKEVKLEIVDEVTTPLEMTTWEFEYY